jgi:hypothetical protein
MGGMDLCPISSWIAEFSMSATMHGLQIETSEPKFTASRILSSATPCIHLAILALPEHPDNPLEFCVR